MAIVCFVYPISGQSQSVADIPAVWFELFLFSFVDKHVANIFSGSIPHFYYIYIYLVYNIWYRSKLGTQKKLGG